ncbi:aspartyl-phosphate phosphatase Spo0E family protein [Domibacillus enclensis]|uniref:Spo0E family sporulation regulatory protein-aspartic acid phosphatase n=1 Tax=Domibacillus enclensis TaxID=1017273 RepID=A0A1N7C0L1_9BACI|nr:aspartyl-phosphate phosphatase Spo0E family protein [Domibacillus enclensis]OXS74184.1 Spo0E family sporulation regulatory protein-aspartic acid phosphatase [Domibacillus enclensis]SIR57013.1 Spo0E like sporulation regulatory protein [Domibacillus enclensis]
MEHRSASTETLRKRIEAQRQIMIRAGQLHGLTAHITIMHSETLDQLIIEYQYAKRMNSAGSAAG